MTRSLLDPPRPSPIDSSRQVTLDDVRRVIPAHCYDRSFVRGLAIAARDVVLYCATLVAIVAVRSPFWSLPLALLAGLFVSAMFVTAHDACHGALVPKTRWNRALALLLMLPSLHVREAWDLGHNRVHHGFTVRQGTDFVWHPLTVERYRSLGRLARLRHRLEWSCIGSGAYYLREVWWNKMMRFEPPARYAKRIRRDWWVVVAATTAVSSGAAAIGWWQGGVASAAWSVLELVVVPFLVFTHVIGWTVHVHHVQPDTRWYSSKEWTKYRAQMEGTTILRLPRLFDTVFHSIFVHVPHHVDMRIPCYRLREAAAAITRAFPGIVVDRKLRLRAYLAATKQCKLYDFDRGCWLSYSDAQSSSAQRVTP